MAEKVQASRYLWIEASLAIAVLLALGYDLYFLIDAGYLPSPFFYEPQDTWMDWFNTAYWAHHPGAYDSWSTIYPPLSFVALKFLTNSSCYVAAEGYTSRDCDWYGAVTLHLVFLINLILTWRILLKVDRTTALPRVTALCLGYPMAFALERGNLIMLCYTCIILAYGPLLRSARLRWIFAGLAVNFKIYLIGPIFAQILKRRWRWFEGALISTVAIYLITFTLLGAGSPMEIYRNIVSFAEGSPADNLLNAAFALTFRPLLSLFECQVPVVRLVGSGPVEFWSTVLPLATLAVQLLVIAAAASAAWRPNAVPMHRLIFFSCALPLITSELGAYGAIFLVFFMFMEPFRGCGRRIAIVCCYLLCIAVDFPLDYAPPLYRDSYLTGRPVAAIAYVGVMPFVRPVLLWAICVSMAFVTFREVWADAKLHGWGWRRRSSPPESATS